MLGRASQPTTVDIDWLRSLDERFEELDAQALEVVEALPPVVVPPVEDDEAVDAVDQPLPTPLPIVERELPPLSAPLVAIAAAHGVRDRDLLKMERFVRAVIVEGKPINVAGRTVGWSMGKVDKVVHQSTAYPAMRAELLSRITRTRDDVHHEIYNVVADTAVVGAHRQNQVVKTSRNEALVHQVAEAAMDRIGAAAPKQAEVKHQVELSEATLALFEKALGGPRRAVLDTDWAFATVRPMLDDDRAMASVGARGVDAETTNAHGYDKPKPATD